MSDHSVSARDPDRRYNTAISSGYVVMEATGQESSRARFGVFELELRTGELCRSGTLLHLSPQPLKVLAMLLKHPGQLVSREDLRTNIWGNDTFVDFEHGLNFAIKKIRDTLGDDADRPAYIETLPRRGYRFIGPVVWINEPATGVHKDIQSPATTTRDFNGDQGKTSDTQPAAPLAARRRFWRQSALALGCVIAAIVLAASISDAIRGRIVSALLFRTAQSPQHISAIAVLPLENLSSDPEQEYFADGLTDSLITDLGQIGTMRVISRASVLQYKRGKVPLPQIAHDLKVDGVIEGTVMRSGPKIRISVQLLDARHDEHLWAQSYERDLQDVISLERQVALAIAHEISGRLTTAQEMRLKKTTAVNPEAYDAYLRASYFLAQRSPEAETIALGYFEQSLHADPGFAPAYAGLAVFYIASWDLPPDVPLAEKYAQKSIALDPDLAEGHTALGFTRLFQRRFPEAQKELKLALTLNQNHALAHHFYAHYWMFMGHPSEALAENSKALQLDPFSFPFNFLRTLILCDLGQYDAALDELQTVAAVSKRPLYLHEWRSQINWAAGKVPEALEEERKIAAAIQLPELLRSTAEVAAIYARAGWRAALAKEAVNRAQGRRRSLRFGGKQTDLYSAQYITALYALLGDREATLYWLNEALKEDNASFPETLMCSRDLEFLRSDPRFQNIEHQLGLPIADNR